MIFESKISDDLLKRVRRIKLLLTDVDGVLTDTGVYYSKNGEELKRFSIRDGMGVELLRNEYGIETGIVTGEPSESVAQRAKKLKITELHLNVKDKKGRLAEIRQARGYGSEEIAFIGDDVNDLGVLQEVGFAACPADAMPTIKQVVHYISQYPGGHGAFREIAELILFAHRNSKGDTL